MKNLTRLITTGLATAALAAFAASTLSTTTVTNAGIIDGSLNDVSAASQSNVLGALVPSRLSIASNLNLNTSPAGHDHNAQR